MLLHGHQITPTLSWGVGGGQGEECYSCCVPDASGFMTSHYFFSSWNWERWGGIELTTTGNIVAMSFILRLAHSQILLPAPPALPPPPAAIDSKESIAEGLECPFSEKNNAWLVSFNERSLWLFQDPQAEHVSLFVLRALQSSLVMAPLCKASLHSWHHLVTFSIQSSFRCQPHLLRRRKVSRGAQDLLTFTWMQLTTKLWSSTDTEGSAFSPSLLLSSPSQAASHGPVF